MAKGKALTEIKDDDRASYVIEFNGDCMGNLVKAGALLTAEPDEIVAPMDLVSVLLVGFTGPWGRFVNGLSMQGFAGIVKLFLGAYEANGERVFLLGQLNPPSIVTIPESAIAAIDRIDFRGKCIDADLGAWSLIAPFAGLGIHPQGIQ